jgi:hypothetical protein
MQLSFEASGRTKQSDGDRITTRSPSLVSVAIIVVLGRSGAI